MVLGGPQVLTHARERLCWLSSFLESRIFLFMCRIKTLGLKLDYGLVYLTRTFVAPLCASWSLAEVGWGGVGVGWGSSGPTVWVVLQAYPLCISLSSSHRLPSHPSQGWVPPGPPSLCGLLTFSHAPSRHPLNIPSSAPEVSWYSYK